MQAHPHPDRPPGQPLLGAERLLGVQDGIQSRAGGREGSTEGVTDGLEDETAGLLDSGAQDLVMPAQSTGHRLRLGLPEARRALDVGKKQRDRSGWYLNRLAHQPKDTRPVTTGCLTGHDAGGRSFFGSLLTTVR